MLPKMDENKGGIVNQGLVALDDVLMQRIMPVLREYYKNVILEIESHKRTLRMFKDCQDGRMDINRLVITDDNWRVLPERPKSELKVTNETAGLSLDTKSDTTSNGALEALELEASA